MREGEPSGEQFLNEKYPDLQKSPEVESAVQQQETRIGEKVPNVPTKKIEAYLDRLERLALDSEKEQPRKAFGTESRPRALSLLREMVMNKYVRSNKEKMSQGAAAVEERAAREMGMEIHYGQEELEQRGEIAVADLEKSLDNWISYLSDMNEPYPAWFRYYAFRNILGLGDYDKDKGEFTKRSRGSARLFPDIDRGALGYVEQMIEAAKDPEMLKRLQKAQQVAAAENIPENQLITKEKAKAFAKMPFAKQYAEAIKQAGEITPEMREETQGKWVKYQQGTDPTALWASLQNKGTPWCTKGFATAETQLKGGDFYVYYTLDKQGNSTIPRLAIRMDGHDKISNDVRGVADSSQNVEDNMVPILDEKLEEFGPEADRFRKKSADMKRLTEIEKKFINTRELQKKIEDLRLKEGIGDQLTNEELELEKLRKQNQAVELTVEELRFLYEIDEKVEGFGYKRDPRVLDIRVDCRDKKRDMAKIFGCKPEQVAQNYSEINYQTVVFTGNLSFDSTNQKRVPLRFPPNIRYVTGSVDFLRASEKITDTGNLEYVGGNAEFMASSIKSLGKIRTIRGNVNFRDSVVESLGDLKTVGGSASFENSKITNLDKLETIGQNAGFAGSLVENLGSLREVGMSIYIDLNSKLDFSNIKHGEITKVDIDAWKD